MKPSDLVTDLVTGLGRAAPTNARFVLAERVGFEPTNLSVGGFQDGRRLLAALPVERMVALVPAGMGPDLVTDLVTA